MLESPIYFNLLHLLEGLNLKIIEIPSIPNEGINLDTLRFVLENQDVKAVFLIPNFNNPIGYAMPAEKKALLLQMLTEFAVPLIEDDIYGDIGFQERPDNCKRYDQKGEVLLCSSFSKTLAPGLRIGWVAPGRYLDQVIRMKTLLNISTTSVNQIAVAKFLKEGGYERYLRSLRKKIQKQVIDMRTFILRHFPKGTYVTKPDGGFLLWVELPAGIDTITVYQEALKKDILISPGSLFTLKEKYGNCMRLNAGTWNADVAAAVQYLGRPCRNLAAE